ncbi:MarR family winged helix-turn-helix transcriptional regulator [Paenibacillus sp. IHBB 10380]|uniref:MarR family winged helix-turn-helix transcriptional regulator n=1 Tax=Paenibacillus sp. IHBB 10380 TaxID=1566358 RepID=UPI0005CFD9A4|nr:MarR family winged helix-turn-helix transcriptional regulator [Paenibacillus sp. IHBB 10380]AJS61039.1 MarR family transcriptional regulator [Paenibacillus sp. IHBB 10380]
MTPSLSEEAHIFDQLQSLNKQISTKFERCAGISPSRLQILNQLYQVDEISQTTLQKEVKIDNAAVTRHIKQLEVAGMVSRRNNPNDNRVTLVTLTNHGRQEIIAYKNEKQQFITQLLKDFKDHERSALSEMLNRMINHISHF